MRDRFACLKGLKAFCTYMMDVKGFVAKDIVNMIV